MGNKLHEITKSGSCSFILVFRETDLHQLIKGIQNPAIKKKKTISTNNTREIRIESTDIYCTVISDFSSGKSNISR